MKGRKITNLVLLMVVCVVSAVGQSHSTPAGSASTLTQKLDFGTQVERSVSGGERHIYTLELGQNQYIKVEALQKNCDIILSLETPEKTNAFEFKDDSFRNGIEVQTAAVTAAGTYLLKIVSFEAASQKGTYSLKISELRPAVDKELSETAAFEITAKLSRVEKGALTTEQIRQLIGQFETALEKFRYAGNRKWEAIMLSSIGTNYTRLGNWSKAADLQRKALEIYRDLGQDKDIVFVLANLGNAYLHNDEPQKALEVLSEAAGLATIRGDSNSESGVLGSIGRVYEEAGDIARALTYYARSLERAEVSTQDKTIAIASYSMGRASLTLGDNIKAAGHFQRSIELSRRMNNKRLEAAALSNLGQTSEALGDLPRAEASFAEALQINRSLADKIGEAGILRNIADIRLRYGKTDEAVELLNRAKEVYIEVESAQHLAETLLLLGQAQAKKGELENAQDSSLRAINLIENLRSKFTSTDLRDSFSLKLQDFYAFYIEILMERHKLEPGKKWSALAFQASESARARGLLNLLAESRADIRQGVDEKLLQKEMEIRSLLSARLENLTKVLNGKIKDETAQELKNDIEQIRSEHERLQENIRSASPRYAALTQPRTLSLHEIQNEVLDENSVLLEYSLGKRKSYLWIVTKTDFRSVELPPAETVEADARQFYDALTARNKLIKFETPAEREGRISRADISVEKVSAELSKLIIEPAVPFLQNKRIIVVADGPLQYIPFAALSIGKSASSQKQRYLVETNEIVNLPSASVLALLRKETAGRRPAAKTLAVLADPIFDKQDERFQVAASKNKPLRQPEAKMQAVALTKSQTRSAGDPESGERMGLARLPFTRREADMISSFVPEGQKAKWLDFAANRRSATSAELSNYRFVHFATHGFINDQNHELSGLVFSMIDENGKEQDGFLRVGDIYNLKLPAEMVVLSGCRTGLGKNIKGEGLVGMTRAFMYSGAKRVTVSLWDINDEATSELMSNFYREMFGTKKRTPATALRQAQNAMINDKRWNSPYFWATFVLQGEFN